MCTFNFTQGQKETFFLTSSKKMQPRLTAIVDMQIDKITDQKQRNLLFIIFLDYFKYNSSFTYLCYISLLIQRLLNKVFRSVFYFQMLIIFAGQKLLIVDSKHRFRAFV